MRTFCVTADPWKHDTSKRETKPTRTTQSPTPGRARGLDTGDSPKGTPHPLTNQHTPRARARVPHQSMKPRASVVSLGCGCEPETASHLPLHPRRDSPELPGDGLAGLAADAAQDAPQTRRRVGARLCRRV